MNVSKERNIVLVPHKQHIFKLFEYINSNTTSKVYTLTWFKDVSDVENGIFVRHFWFGLRVINKIVKYQIHIPVYLFRLNYHLKKLKPEVLVVYDFYHWYFLQCLWYTRENKQCRIFLYSETKRWPKGILPRAVMKIFMSYVVKKLRTIDKVFVYTEEGQHWWKQNSSGLNI